MLKKRIVRMLLFSAVITTGTLIACIMWYTITIILNKLPMLSSQIPFVTLWQILSIGIICGAGTEFILCGGEEASSGGKIRIVMHCIFINAVVLVAGYFYGWYKPSPLGILLMCLTSALVYAFTACLAYANEIRIANKMNEKLRELKENREKEEKL